MSEYRGLLTDRERDILRGKNGTFCFYDVEPRAEPFAEWEQTIVEFLGEWVSLKLTDQRGPKGEAWARLSRGNYDTRILN